jgi:hypothetical protein
MSLDTWQPAQFGHAGSRLIVLLYLATVLFYWWPLAIIYKLLWVAQALLFVISTTLNVTSHKGSQAKDLA